MAQEEYLLQWANNYGKVNTLEARFDSWHRVLETISPLGSIIGHGTYFWEQNSIWREIFTEKITADGWKGFSHSHNVLVDLFVAFGLLGSVPLFQLIHQVSKNAAAGWSGSMYWLNSATPWLMIIAVLLHGFGTSVAVFRPSGWLLAGFILGGFAVRERDLVPERLWAPSGSNRRPTD